MREYRRLVRLVMDHGAKRSPRGLATRDIGHTTVVIENTTRALPLGVGRKLWAPIGAMEAIQLIAGQPMDPHLIIEIAPQFKQFMNGGLFHGSYGNRIGTQMLTVANRLNQDPETRQAIVTLWDPERDQISGMKDYPCTVALRFTIAEDDTLEMDVIMRSNDVWRGFAYDVFQFTQLQRTLAHSLYKEPGVYRHTTWSMHLYESDLDAVDEFMDFNMYRSTYDSSWQPLAVGRIGHSMIQLRKRARMIMDGVAPDDATVSEEWYLEQLSRRPTDVG